MKYTINEKLPRKLRSNKLDVDSYMCACIGIHFGYKPDVQYKKGLVDAGIVEVVKKRGKTSINLLVPVFNDTEIEWHWVTNEFDALFKNVRSDCGGYGSQCIKKMKKVFTEDPSIRKDDVIAATVAYIASVNNVNMLMRSHNFINKSGISELTKTCKALKEESTQQEQQCQHMEVL